MQVYYHLVFFVSILSTSVVITESVKEVVEKNNASINKGKWHVGRVSRKQYEIINMLRRKTKVFMDTKTTKDINNSLNTVNKHKKYKNSQHVTLVNHNPIQESFQLAHPESKVYSSTSSYIEFYYLDELDERINNHDNNIKNNNSGKTKSEVFENFYKMSRSPFFLFRANEATCKLTTPAFSSRLLSSRLFSSSSPHQSKSSSKLTKTNNQNKTKRLKISGRNKIFDTTKSLRISKTRSISTKIINMLSKKEPYKSSNKYFHSIINKYTSVSESTTAVNDHIRFFDIYDNNIYTPYMFIEDDEYKMVNSNAIHNEKKINDKDKIVKSNVIQNEIKINLDQVDHTQKFEDKNKTRYVKKHVIQDKDHLKGNYGFYNVGTTVVNIYQNPTISQSHVALWSEFPFVAAYVYEPTQVRCDAASISPHWLVAAASCLNRHHKDIKAEGRSAFVAYCSGNWQHPGRIAYVKQSITHPRFHPKDYSRRQLYNIGAIQVVNSMADTCNGWAPISLMSHQFYAPRDGTSSIALGWGLDRYGSSYSLSQLPKHLALYKGLVYSNSCPGNTGYSKARRLDEWSIRNVYCLSLPPYTKEENDPVHGSMLLIGGKLIALYMQEERRRQGDQSAQYTGIWHLIPWLLNVAREPDELDPFHLDM